MDKIVTTIKSRFDERERKRRLREANTQKLIITHNGGMFKITPELFSMLAIFEDESIILEDTYGNPIRCDRLQLLIQAKQRYAEVMNSWHAEFARK